MDKKAQLTLEFFFVIALILIIFISTLSFYYTKKSHLNSTRDDLDRLDTCKSLASLINEAYISKSNPNIIFQSYYDIEITKDIILIDDVSCKIFADVKKAILTKGNISITKDINSTIILKNE